MRETNDNTDGFSINQVFNIISVFIIVSLLAVAVYVLMDRDKSGVSEGIYIKGDYDQTRVVNYDSVNGDTVLLLINGKNALVKEGDTYIVDDDKSHYVGSVEVIELNGDEVLLSVDFEKSKEYYSTMLIFTMFLGGIATIVVAINSL